MEASINIHQSSLRIKPDMLVFTDLGSLGVVTKVTQKWVHFTILIRENLDYERSVVLDNHPYHGHYRAKRKDLTLAPTGMKFTVKQRA